MRKIFKSNLYLLVVLIVYILGSIPMAYVCNKFNIVDIKIRLFLSHTIFFILPAIIYFAFSKKSIKDILKLNKLHFKDTILVIILAFASVPMMMFLSLISQFIFPNNVGEVINSSINSPYIVLLLLFAAMPAITEEITIRGIVLSGYEDKNMYISAVITGLFFAIMHLDGQQFLYAMAVGIILALVVRITKSIFSSMLIHFIVNGVSVTSAKIVEVMSKTGGITDVAAEQSLTSLPMEAIIVSIVFFGILFILSGIIIAIILKKLIKLNIERGTITKNDVKLTSSNENTSEKIFNLPFILILIVYMVFMLIFN